MALSPAHTHPATSTGLEILHVGRCDGGEVLKLSWQLANTETLEQSRRERKKVEMRFAHIKRILRLDRFRLRGLSGVRDEVLLTATRLRRSLTVTRYGRRRTGR